MEVLKTINGIDMALFSFGMLSFGAYLNERLKNKVRKNKHPHLIRRWGK